MESIRQQELITDPEDARALIHEQFARGERPVISVPEEYAPFLTRGLAPRATWIPGFEAIVGTFGRAPYVPPGEKRVLVKVELDENQIIPRFTGPSKSYQGIVVIYSGILRVKLWEHYSVNCHGI